MHARQRACGTGPVVASRVLEKIGGAPMRNAVSLTLIVAALVVLGGCETSGHNATANARYAKLPTGVTLLNTDTGRCSGSVQVREEQSGHVHEQQLVLAPGENATFPVDVRDGDRLSWACVGDTRSGDTRSVSTNRVDCPDATSHVRISRRAEGSDLTLECFGRRSSRS